MSVEELGISLSQAVTEADKGVKLIEDGQPRRERIAARLQGLLDAVKALDTTSLREDLLRERDSLADGLVAVSVAAHCLQRTTGDTDPHPLLTEAKAAWERVDHDGSSLERFKIGYHTLLYGEVGLLNNVATTIGHLEDTLTKAAARAAGAAEPAAVQPTVTDLQAGISAVQEYAASAGIPLEQPE